MDKKSVLEALVDNMNNMLRGGSKLNLVFASIVVILAGIVAYLIYNEKRIKSIEDRLKDKK
jgi:predicted Co/Zn/Cd cation transporter (cation efflux family)